MRRSEHSRRRIAALALVTVLALSPRTAAQRLAFAPDHPTGIYAVGQRVGWTVTAPGPAAAGARYRYTILRDGGEVVRSGQLEFSKGRARIETALGGPGMVLVEVSPLSPDTSFGDRSTGGPGRVLLGAAVEPTSIRAAEPRPADFDAFWAAKLAQLAAVPMDAVVAPGEGDRPGVTWATVRLNSIDGSHVYGQLARPAREGRFPALVIFQWASPPYPLQRSWVTDRAAEGWLVLDVEPHDVPPDLPPAFYDALPALLKHYETIGDHSRDRSYFLRMYLGDVRAVDYLAGRPDWDGRTLVVTGTSMGGQQAFATAGLSSRVTALIADVPAGADVAAPLHGRAPSYPDWDITHPEILETARYFDTVNFASRITARALVGMGFIDRIAAPTGIWAVFNQIRGPKEAAPMVEAPHNNLATPRQRLPFTRRAAEWLDILVHGGDPTAGLTEPTPLPDRTSLRPH